MYLLMTKRNIKHTEFTQNLIDSEAISNNVKGKLLKFIENAQKAEILSLFKMLEDVTTDLTKQTGANMKNEIDRLNGILLIIVEDEIKLRGETPYPEEN